MRTIRFLLQKEFLQIFRNRAMLPIIFLMPVVQLLLLSFAATYDVDDVPIGFVDQDRTITSRKLANKLEASGYFEIVFQSESAERAGEKMLDGTLKMILTIPVNFERDIQRNGSGSVQMVVNAVDGATAGVIQAYASQILGSFGQEVQAEIMASSGAEPSRPAFINVVPRPWYNPDLNYTTYMVPGILVILVTMIGTFLSSMSVVREKEIGTIEQLNVTPIKRYQFVIGKLLPFWILALIELAIGLVIAKLVFDLPMLGNLFLVFGIAGVYMLAMLGIGLWISTVTDTQQQAMFIAWFLIVIFILMSGLFTPVESMPHWAQYVNKLNPIAYFINIMRRVLLTGATLSNVYRPFLALVIYTLVMLTIAVRQYRKVAG